MNKIAMFGATGKTGLCALDAAVKQGCSVTLLVRDASRVPSDFKDNPAVKLLVGNVKNLEDVEKTVDGSNSVVVTLGTRGDLSPTTDLSNGLKNIIHSMLSRNIKKISVCFSAFLFYEPDKVPVQFRALNAEHKRMYDILQANENLDWIAVYPPHISDEPSSKYIIKHGEHPGPRVISKYDLGSFLVESLNLKEHYKKIVGIANVPN